MKVIIQDGVNPEQIATATFISKEDEVVAFKLEDGTFLRCQQVGDFWFEVGRPHVVFHIQPYKEQGNGDL